MLDFTSSLYLGLLHEAWSLRPWSQLTTGKPAALAEPPGAREAARQLAQLQGCERATLASSSLHLFWDMFGLLSRANIAIYLDAGAYPIVKWGVERAAARGVPVIRFGHKDAGALQRAVAQSPHSGRRPVIVTDGICTCCGCQAPIATYHDIVHERGGWLVIDDTQALGLLGHSPGPEAPYGRGGGGSLPRSGVRCGDVIVVSSLAKAFGVPMAALAGSAEFVGRFEARSETQRHCSPPSAAEIHAAQRALALNETHGDHLRAQLAKRVRYFRSRLSAAGLSADGGIFPVQTIRPLPGADMTVVHRRLRELDVRTILRAGNNGHDARISFILTVRHRADEIERGVDALASAVNDIVQAQAQPQSSHG
jgi:8-amino-7-oxononanoate synthase